VFFKGSDLTKKIVPIAPAPNRVGWISPWKLSLVFLAALGAVWMLRLAQAVIVPIFVAVLISYALEPVVSRLEKFRIPRFIGAAVVLLAVVIVVLMGGYFLRDDVAAILDDLPDAAQKLRSTLNDGLGKGGLIEKIQEAATAVEDTAAAASGPTPAPKGVTKVQVQEKPVDLNGIIYWGPAGVLSGLSSVVLLLFLVYFLLIAGDLYRRKLVKLAGPTLAKRKITVDILNDISNQVQRFVVVQVLTSTVVAIASAIAFQWVGLERAIVWGLAAGIFNSIPYFGPFLVAAGISVVAFLQFGSIEIAIYIALIAIVITTLEGFLLTPWLMGRTLGVNGVALFVGLMVWAWIWGIWGMLLAVPMMVIIKAICDRIEDLHPIAELLGD
jgi:predicted PurR-regulated permease PerM